MNSPNQNSKERTVLKISIVGALFMMLLGFGFSILTDSEAVFLDGVFSLVNMTMGLITLKVSHIIFEKSTKRFHYGKAQVEPLLNTAKGLLFIGVIVMAGYAALQSILAAKKLVNPKRKKCGLSGSPSTNINKVSPPTENTKANKMSFRKSVLLLFVSRKNQIARLVINRGFVAKINIREKEYSAQRLSNASIKNKSKRIFLELICQI